MEDIDIGQLLRRVVNEVFGADVDVQYEPSRKYKDDWRASVASATVPSRTVSLRATYEWFSVNLQPFDVGTVDFDYGYDEDEKAAVLRRLAGLACAYLEGEGEVEVKPSRFGRRERATVTVPFDGEKWVLGKRSSRIVPA